jgi:hypothetical protein
MNSPRYPDKVQLEALQKAVQVATPERRRIAGNQMQLVLPGNGLAVLEIK